TAAVAMTIRLAIRMMCIKPSLGWHRHRGEARLQAADALFAGLEEQHAGAVLASTILESSPNREFRTFMMGSLRSRHPSQHAVGHRWLPPLAQPPPQVPELLNRHTCCGYFRILPCAAWLLRSRAPTIERLRHLTQILQATGR